MSCVSSEVERLEEREHLAMRRLTCHYSVRESGLDHVRTKHAGLAIGAVYVVYGTLGIDLERIVQWRECACVCVFPYHYGGDSFFELFEWVIMCLPAG